MPDHDADHDDRSPDPRSAGSKPPFTPQTQELPGRSSEMVDRPDYGEASYRGLGRLRDRVALVTGGDSGIGRAVALAFAREGADVVIANHESHDDAHETRRLVESAGRHALLSAGDLGDESYCRELVARTLEAFGHLDVLVNNAAYQGEAVEHLEEIDPARLERTFRTNVLGMFHLTRAALQHLKPGATIINTSSIQAYQPKPSILDYAATKGAIVAFTKGLAQETVKRGIRANSVAPGPVWTPLIQASFPPDHVEHFGESSPMGRPAQPAEVAPAFVFLACDESRFVNGEILGVTGGQILA